MKKVPRLRDLGVSVLAPASERFFAREWLYRDCLSMASLITYQYKASDGMHGILEVENCKGLRVISSVVSLLESFFVRYQEPETAGASRYRTATF